MKPKTFLLIIVTAFLLSSPVFSQGVDKNINDKADIELKKLEDNVQLDKSQKNNIRTIYSRFFSRQQQLKNNIQRPANVTQQNFTRQNFQAVRKQNEQLISDRDGRIKQQLSESQYKKWRGNTKTVNIKARRH